MARLSVDVLGSTILSAMSWLVGVPDEAQDEIFRDGDPRITGVFSPTGTGSPQSGGLVVNGRLGIQHRRARQHVDRAQRGRSNRRRRRNADVRDVPSRELKRLDDWHASGMAATGSNTILAEDLFVPVHRTMPLPVHEPAAKYPARHNSTNAYFNYPLAAVLTVNAGRYALGAARGALEAFHEWLPGRGIRAVTNYTNKAEAAVTHLQIAEATLKLDSTDAHIRRACALLDHAPNAKMSVLDRIKARAHISYATGLAREVVDILFYASGASAIQSHVPIQRFQRDIQALANSDHASADHDRAIRPRALWIGAEHASVLTFFVSSCPLWFS